MTISIFRSSAIALLLALLATGCATQKAYDYSAFKASKPRSILVLPPVNSSPDVAATYGMFSQVSYPLAESGYYVLPVTLVDETFKQNGLTTPADIQNVPPAKLREIFNADAGLYIDVKKYGSVYQVVDSVTTVTAEAKLIDLKTGTLLWQGSATASSNEQNNSNSGGLVGLLVTAIVKQIVASTTESGYKMAGVTSNRLLTAGRPNGLLYGPHSPKYGSD
ncbi:hypothetical protein FHW67_000094 [Herbaspirillum sp. Sphag1AN]|uniref:DUF799 domain-containing protein n=1 Tax=unclassified Herbaspirillum TaxID=2624150 RepID=UPI00160EE9C9|nr:MULTISPECIES: DUF799 domain-containing protein [unclassified Herbaspirillum]MBB3210859.1 hypothetical protein [Herbaspirillum sp. Sphag1AN]MBB3244489.1 hypothetical protein [Herbaspirillum sp. Sphag64]